MAKHKVRKEGDHIVRIAVEHGFKSWETIWKANKSLESAKGRKNPLVLFHGDKSWAADELTLPSKAAEPVKQATDDHVKFVVPMPKLCLRLRVLGEDFTPVKDAPFELVIEGGETHTGKTDADGRVLVAKDGAQVDPEVPPTATTARLSIGVEPKKPSGGADDGGLAGPTPVSFELKLGRLDPIMEKAPTDRCTAGVQQRLNNLRLNAGPVDGLMGANTRAAIEAFQSLFQLEVDGIAGQGETQPKLLELFDKGTLVGPPPGTLEIKHPVPADKQLETAIEDIGHVALDFLDAAAKFVNSLVIRPSYRVSLKLGDVDALFPHEPNTPEGRMERLQALGLFYFPLKHARARTAFDGVPAQAGPPAVPAMVGAWQHFKTNVLNGADDAAADAEIKSMLAKRIIDGGKLPAPAADGAAPTKDNFAKIRIPGGYTFVNDNTGLDLNLDAAYPFAFGADSYAAETKFHDDNPVLCKVPLVAFVEKQDFSGNWHPAPDVEVYFQLQAPYDLPGFDAAANAHEQLDRPQVRPTTVGPPAGGPAPLRGPAALTTAQETPTGARKQDDKDPQKGNARFDRGGLQGHGSLADGSDVAGHLFEVASRAGFNAAHGARALPFTALPVAEQAAPVGDSHKHAVKAKSNADGFAGVIFVPSRCGGDRYRLRAYVGPPNLLGPGSDGNGPGAARVDTGTFVVWRNMRVSRYVQQPVGNPAPALLAEANTPNYSIATNAAYLQTAFVCDSVGTNVGLPTADFSGTGNASAVFDGVRRQWARAFVEVEIDRAAAASLPATMTQADWQAARNTALADCQAGQATLGLNLNLPVLFHMETGTTVTMANAVTNIPMRSWEAYNAHPSVTAAQRIVGGAVGNTIANINSMMMNFALPGFLRAFSHLGFAPGLTVITGGYGYTWQLLGLDSNYSGLALNYRGCFVWAGNAAYPNVIPVPPLPAPPGPPAPPQPQPPWMPYDFSSNTCHEMGHVCYREHGPGFDPGSGAPGGAKAARHDVQTANQSLCVMSYQSSEGQFCAHCLFAFRGWDERSI
ncbi:MAG: peptidoglycan-binding protein [Planctomycetes bacterium]|nr:peptidoglycan-binding protein [Planctomycetota bacterium]